jgi:guanylate kinase
MDFSGEMVPLLLLISAPSGTGKSTVCERLLAAVPSLTRAVTCTTRPPRQGEREGVHYHFLGNGAFQKKVAAGEFLEHAIVYGYRYGTLKSELAGKLRAGRDVLLNVDVQGAATVRGVAAQDPQLGRSLATVFLAPPSAEALEGRLRGRGLDSEAVIQRRLEAARQELAHWREFDYLVISGTMDEDLRRMKVIYEAEKMRPARVAG